MDRLGYGIIGMGGWGVVHLRAVEALEREGEVTLRAVTTTSPDRHREKVDELLARGVRVYTDYLEMLQQERELDIVSIPAPIHLHVPMSMACFERGLHVMLEKPPAVLVQDVDRIVEAADRCRCLCQVGFQNVADPAARELKARIAAGEIGRVREMVVTVAWCRLDSYYTRARWAGRLRVGDDWVLDGPLNNPQCHYPHQALLVGCSREHDTLRPLTARAELYRAHRIEGEDILCARAELEEGVTLHTYLTLCAQDNYPPTIEVVGERGTAIWQLGRYEMKADAGHVDRSFELDEVALYRNLVRAVRGEEPLWSPPAATRNIILHNNGCFASTGVIRPLPEEKVRRTPTPDGDVLTEVDALKSLIDQAAASRRLFSEMGVDWAVETPTVLLDFKSFDPSPLLGQ